MEKDLLLVLTAIAEILEEEEKMEMNEQNIETIRHLDLQMVQ